MGQTNYRKLVSGEFNLSIALDFGALLFQPKNSCDTFQTSFRKPTYLFTLKKISVIILSYLLLTDLSSFAQDAKNVSLCGTYGRYIDYSTFTELQLHCDSTFLFIDCFELGSTYKYRGTWEVKRNKILLKSSTDGTISHLPLRWKKRKEVLISEKLHSNKFRLKGRISLPKKLENRMN